MSIANQNNETYLDVLGTLNESTDDYLFLGDFTTGRYHYRGNIGRRFSLQDKGHSYCTVEEILQVVYPNDREALIRDLDLCARGEKDIHNMEYRWIDRDGNVVWISCRGKVQRNKDGRPVALLGRISDTILLSKVDALTGLLNRRKLMEDLAEFLASGEPGYLVTLGVDDFKNVNIRRGRDYGDCMLKNLAGSIEVAAGGIKQIYRIESDRFAVHLPYFDKEAVCRFYHSLQKMLPEEYTVSAGAVSYLEAPSANSNDVYGYVEEALDKAKKCGKNTISFFSEEDFLKKVAEVELLAEIKDSVKNGCEGFFLVYQPQVDATNFSVFGAEALLRYRSAVRGQVFPDQFIPILERTGLICQVGLWVLRTALEECKKWRQTTPDFHMSVNVSYVQLQQNDVAEQFLKVLNESGLPGNALTLEVTESIQLQDFVYFNDIFKKWKQVGIEISVDDFGTGYSSLSYLKNLQIDEIKIDRCFISGIQFSSYNYRLISNMLELARGSAIRVCCEGVELEDEMKVLKGLRTNLMQGYLFSKPCDTDQFQKLYVENHVPDYCERLQSIQPVPTDAEEGVGRSSALSDARQREIFAKTELGIWAQIYDQETDRNEMYVDETMRRLLALEGDPTPEKTFSHWYCRINDGYYEYVLDSIKKIMETGRMVQLEYTWNHPFFGDVAVRCTGRRIEDLNGKICIVGYHRIFSDIEATSFLLEAPTTERFEYNHSKHQIFFHTDRSVLNGDKIRESNFPAGWVESELVHPQCADDFRAVFCDANIKGELIGGEFMLKDSDGGYSMYKLVLKRLGSDPTQRNTVLAILDKID